MLKRSISLLISLFLIISCLTPFSVLADDTVYYDVIFLDEEGEQIDSVYRVKNGNTIDASLVPELPQGNPGYEAYVIDDGGQNHSSYSWDAEPTETPITSNTIFRRVRTTEKHDYNFGRPQFKFQANNKSGLMAFYECPKCGSVGEVGVEIVDTSLSQGLKLRVDASAIGGDSVAYEGWLDVGQIKTIVELMQKVGVPIPGWVNTVLTVLDTVADVADKIVEQTTECAKTGHLYGAPSYLWNDSHTECTAVFTCTRSDCKSNYSNHTVEKRMSVTGPEYTYATCTKDGTETYVATCKFTDTDKGTVDGFDASHDFTTSNVKVWQKKQGHNYSEPQSNGDATCFADGTYSQVCTRCGNTITKPDVGSMLTHIAGRTVIENDIPATCKSSGSYDEVKYCVFCGTEMQREGKTHPQLEHHLKEPVKANIVEPTCTETGSHDLLYYCNECNELINTEHVVDPSKGHNKKTVIENATASTCTSGGTYDKVEMCLDCKEVFSRTQVTLDPAPHNYQDTVIEATCTTEGKLIKTCSVCGYSYTAEYYYDLPEHNYELKKTKEPTCSVKGEKIYECSICHDVKSEDINKIEHSWDDGSITTPETCTENGIKTYECTVCGETRTEEVLKKKHHYEAETVQPTCTEVGYTKFTCSNCNDVYYDNYVEAKDHVRGGITQENVIAPSCTAEGSYDLVCKCNVCENELSREHIVVEKTEHDTDKIIELPTCSAQGYTMFKCKDCGYEYKASFTNKLPHTPGAEVVENEVAATCTTKGSYDTVTYCSKCGEEVSRVSSSVEAKGHSWNDGVITVQPTTTEKGLKTYTCADCGATKTEVLPVITVDEATPDDDEADNANVNKDIQKPKNIRTVSQFKKNRLHIFFEKVEGAQNYRVMYRKAGTKKWNYAWTDGKTEYYLTNLKSGGLYEFMFAAYKKNADNVWERGAYSNVSSRYYKKQKIKKATAGKNSIKVTWNYDKNSNGYELFYATNAKMTNRKKIVISNKKKTSYTIKKLKSGKKYYIRVRSIKKKNGKSFIGEYSSQKKIKAK